MANLTFNPTLLDVLFDTHNGSHVQIVSSSINPVNDDWFTCKDLKTGDFKQYPINEYDITKAKGSISPVVVLDEDQLKRIDKLEEGVKITGYIEKRE